MRIYEAGRRRGKTTQILRWFQERSDRVIVVATMAEKDRLLNILPDVNRADYESRIIPMRDRVKLRAMSEMQIGIDNLDLVINELMGAPIDYATVTRDVSR